MFIIKAKKHGKEQVTGFHQSVYYNHLLMIKAFRIRLTDERDFLINSNKCEG